MNTLKSVSPGWLGFIVGFLAAVGIYFVLLKPNGTNNSFLNFVLMLGLSFGLAIAFDRAKPEEWREGPGSNLPGPPPMSF